MRRRHRGAAHGCAHPAPLSCTASRPLPPPQRQLRPYACVRRACLLACRVSVPFLALLALFARRVAVSLLCAPVCAGTRNGPLHLWSWLDIGAARRMIGQNIVQLDWADGLGLEGVCSVRVCGLVAAQTGILGPERQRANLHVCPSFSVFFCWLMCGPVSTIVS